LVMKMHGPVPGGHAPPLAVVFVVRALVIPLHKQWGVATRLILLSPHLSPLMSMLKLNCLIFGDHIDSIFDLEIERTKSVLALKERIKTECPGSVTIDAKSLQLFLVSIPCDDATSDEKFTQDVQYACNTQQPLRSKQELSDVFQQIDLDEEHLYIIAKDPAVGSE